MSECEASLIAFWSPTTYETAAPRSFGRGVDQRGLIDILSLKLTLNEFPKVKSVTSKIKREAN